MRLTLFKGNDNLLFVFKHQEQKMLMSHSARFSYEIVDIRFAAYIRNRNMSTLPCNFKITSVYSLISRAQFFSRRFAFLSHVINGQLLRVWSLQQDITSGGSLEEQSAQIPLSSSSLFGLLSLDP